MKNETSRAMFVFVIPFFFVWLGSLMASYLDNTIFEIVLAVIVFLGAVFYWGLLLMMIVAVEGKLEVAEKDLVMKRTVLNNPKLKKKFGHIYENKEVEEN